MKEDQANTERYALLEQLAGALETAIDLDGRDPKEIDIPDLFPGILKAVPGATEDDMFDALRWSIYKSFEEARALRNYARTIIKAYQSALDGQDQVDILFLLPSILAAVPEATVEDVVISLRWAAQHYLNEADRLAPAFPGFETWLEQNKGEANPPKEAGCSVEWS
jgi:hypothetical protein